MPNDHDTLPQLGERLFLTDGGIETTLIFLDGFDLPLFSAFDLFKSAEGEAALRKYLTTYADIAWRFGTGLVLESATRRASRDWGHLLGYTAAALADANRQAIHLIEEIRERCATRGVPVVISGCVGPRGDGYVPGAAMSEEEAEAYHAELNDATELDIGDPEELGRNYSRLTTPLRGLRVMGACCGTDHRHLEQIAAQCAPLFPAAT